MKIPIKHAIESGAWFKCNGTLSRGFIIKSDYEFSFRFRVLLFNKISLDEIDEPEKIETIKIDEGVLYILKIDAVNLKKDADQPDSVQAITLVDQDDFIFNSISDYHVKAGSNFAKSTGLRRFTVHSSELQPKIKVSGAVAFQLPDDDKAEYYLSCWGGNIQEV